MTPKIIHMLALSGLTIVSFESLASFRAMNYNPLAYVAGVPAFADPALMDRGGQMLGLSLAISNHFVPEFDEKDPLFLDGETYTTELRWGMRFEHVQIELMLPWVSHRQGRLDGFIEDWHDTFGLPNAGRDFFASNQLLFSYQGSDNILIEDSTAAQGDLRLSFSFPLLATEMQQHSFTTQLKLPTADAQKLSGDEALAVAVFASHQWQQGDDWHFYLQEGVLLSDDGDLLEEQKRNYAAYFTVGAGYKIVQPLTLIVQLDTHSGLYKETRQSALRSGQVLSIGFSIDDASGQWDLLVLEDVAVDSAPDVAYQLAYTYRFTR